jgi:hypothetical protein
MHLGFEHHLFIMPHSKTVQHSRLAATLVCLPQYFFVSMPETFKAIVYLRIFSFNIIISAH